ncbi:MAG TPA: hypothetical protein VLM20_02370, partial [Methylophilaceae bacterium]|nr:hypothetical protein [Methylophilaceae bacterium]
AIQTTLPNHVLYCDLMTKSFFDSFAQSVHKKLVASGGTFTDRPINPKKIFIDNQYILEEQTPMFKRAAELGLLWREVKMPMFVSKLLLNYFLKDIAGYAIHKFSYNKMK